MKEVLNFLKETGLFYIATVDGDQPTVRPFAFFMEFEKKLYFATSENKKCVSAASGQSKVSSERYWGKYEMGTHYWQGEF